jgi:hypothetical protein
VIAVIAVSYRRSSVGDVHFSWGEWKTPADFEGKPTFQADSKYKEFFNLLCL